MLRIKISSEKKQVNEFLGGLFSRNSSTSSSKQQMSAKDTREVEEFVKSIDEKLGAQKLKSLGVSLVDLYKSIDDATKVFSGGKGAIQSLSSNKTQVVINLLKQDYDDVVKRVQEKKLTSQEANEVVIGIIKIAGAYNSLVPAMMEEGNDELNEAFGMQKKAIRSFIQNLKLFNPDGTLSDKKAADAQPIATAPATQPVPKQTATPPPPPSEAQVDDKAAAAQAAMTEVPPSGQQAQTQSQDKTVALVQNIFKLGLQRARFGFKTNPSPEMIAKVVTYLKSNNHMNEALSIPQKGGLANRIASALGYKTTDEVKQIIEILTALDKGLKKDVKYVPASQKPSAKPPVAPIPQVKGVTPDAKASQDIADAFAESKKKQKLSEQLIERKKQETFSEKDAKRFKLLAGLL